MTDVSVPWKAAPIFRYADVQAAIDHYRDRLGFVFHDESIYRGPGAEGVVYAIACRDGLEIGLGRARMGWPVNPGEAPNALGAYIHVPDVDGVFQDLEGRGADIVQPPTLEPWGARVIVVRDLAGYHLSFASPG